MKNSLILGLVCLLMTQCKLDTSIELPDTPVFVVNAIFGDSVKLDLAGGVNDYYMFTDFSDTGNVLVLNGTLRRVSCLPYTNCSNSLSFDIYPDTSGQVKTGTVNFTEAQSTPVADGFGGVRIHYVDLDGQIWISELLPQPAGSFFRVNYITDYLKNEQEQNTQQLDVSWQCLLTNLLSGEERTFSGSGVIGVAVP